MKCPGFNGSLKRQSSGFADPLCATVQSLAFQDKKFTTASADEYVELDCFGLVFVRTIFTTEEPSPRP